MVNMVNMDMQHESHAHCSLDRPCTVLYWPSVQRDPVGGAHHRIALVPGVEPAWRQWRDIPVWSTALRGKYSKYSDPPSKPRIVDLVVAMVPIIIYYSI
jgi:hypothetical protein